MKSIDVRITEYTALHDIVIPKLTGAVRVNIGVIYKF